MKKTAPLSSRAYIIIITGTDMARSLNKSRMHASRMALIASLVIVFFSRQYWPEETLYHEIFEILGVTMIALCAIGRVYSTAFLGGLKNDVLVTQGVYSVVRNPLYFFSLIGITGIALLSNHISIMIGLPLFFAILYARLIKREQAYLHEKFGDLYLDYKQNTCSMVPNFSNYNAPETVKMHPRFLTKSVLDAVWWLAAFPVIELAEYLQIHKIIPVFFTG